MLLCFAKSVSKASDSSGATSVPSFKALGDGDKIPSPHLPISQLWHIFLSQLLHFSGQAKWRQRQLQELLDLQDVPGVQVP